MTYWVYILASKPGGTLYVGAALQREKNIKHWSREWKIDLIVSRNPEWRIYTKKLSTNADDGLPGQARQ